MTDLEITRGLREIKIDLEKFYPEWIKDYRMTIESRRRKLGVIDELIKLHSHKQIPVKQIQLKI
jgi:hypothetical protein